MQRVGSLRIWITSFRLEVRWAVERKRIETLQWPYHRYDYYT